MFSCTQCGYSTDVKCNWIRHQQRKTPCTSQIVQNVDTINAQNVENLQNVEAITVQNVENGHNVEDVGKTLDRFTPLEDNSFECKTCFKKVCTHLKRHLENCKGIPKNTCKYCKRLFTNRSTFSKHQKNCKATPNNVQNNVQNNTTTVNNQQINNHNSNNTTIVVNYNDNRTYNIVQASGSKKPNVFGHEDLTEILNRMEEEPQLRDAVGTLKTALALVHFNSDHPENQTVRRMNRRSNTIELRQSVDPERWDLEPFELGLQKVLDNIQRQLKVDIRETLPVPFVRDQVYQLSKVQPKIPTSEIFAGPTLMPREPLKQNESDMAKLHEIANEEREAFLGSLVGSLAGSSATDKPPKIEVHHCETFKGRLHDAFKRRGLLYDVVNPNESGRWMHIYRFLNNKGPLDYVQTRI